MKTSAFPMTFAWAALSALLMQSALAADPAGMVKTLTGTALVERPGQKLPLAVGGSVYSGDRIQTGSNSFISLTLRDNTQLTAGANATLEINKFEFNTTTHAGALDATLKKGSLSVISGKVAKANPNAVSFNTSTVTLGVRGTEFIIEAGSEEALTPKEPQ